MINQKQYIKNKVYVVYIDFDQILLVFKALENFKYEPKIEKDKYQVTVDWELLEASGLIKILDHDEVTVDI